MKLFTIGHGNLALEAFISALQGNEVRWVADVRSAPYSRMFPWFNKAALVQALEEAGIRYLFLGNKLGGKPREGETEGEWAQGRMNPALVSDLSRTKRWAEGIAYLAGAVTAMDEDNETGCLLCSENDPNNCHRSLISLELEQMLPGLEVQHLRPGRYEAEVHFQKTLFAVSDDHGDYH